MSRIIRSCVGFLHAQYGLRMSACRWVLHPDTQDRCGQDTYHVDSFHPGWRLTWPSFLPLVSSVIGHSFSSFRKEIMYIVRSTSGWLFDYGLGLPVLAQISLIILRPDWKTSSRTHQGPTDTTVYGQAGRHSVSTLSGQVDKSCRTLEPCETMKT